MDHYEVKYDWIIERFFDEDGNTRYRIKNRRHLMGVRRKINRMPLYDLFSLGDENKKSIFEF